MPSTTAVSVTTALFPAPGHPDHDMGLGPLAYALPRPTIQDLWNDGDIYALWRIAANHDEFRNLVLTIVGNDANGQEQFDETLTLCTDCHDPALTDETHSTHVGDTICESCRFNNYTMCEHCEELYPDNRITIINDSAVCNSCRRDNYSLCQECDEWYNPNFHRYNGEHDHDDDESNNGDCCDIHEDWSFSIRNDGLAPLQNDTRTSVTLPSGMISRVGLLAIAQYLRTVANDIPTVPNPDYVSDPNAYGYGWHSATMPHPDTINLRQLSYLIEDTTEDTEPLLDPRWQTRDGNYTKRISRFAYKRHGLRLSPNVLSEIGNLAAAHSKGSTVDIEVTRQLNLSAADFYHESSCWWSSHSESRCAAKSVGLIGLRSFGPHPYSGRTDAVTGRAWVMPLAQIETPIYRRRSQSANESCDCPTCQPVPTTAANNESSNNDEQPSNNKPQPTVSYSLVPTDSTLPTDLDPSSNLSAFIVFNGYGALSDYTPARIISHMSGWTYKKITFTCSPMYVNNGNGYLVGPEDIVKRYDTSGSNPLRLSVASH